MTIVRAVAVLAGLAAGCAQGTCPSCPSALLVANGSTDLTSNVGDKVTFEWSSVNADTASSTVDIAPTADHCGNVSGPWVISTLQGISPDNSLLACQSGFTYTLVFSVMQAASGMTATSTVTIVVN